MNIIAIHGKSRHLDECWLPSLKEDLKDENIEIIAPHFSTGEDINVYDWYKTMDTIKKYINGETIFICHSLGTNFIFKYLFREKIKCKAVIAVAGGISRNRVGLVKQLRLFIPRWYERHYLVNNIKYRYHIQSDHDGTWLPHEVSRFNRKFKGEITIIKGAAHFGKRSGVKHIPELTQIIKEIIKK